MEQEYENLLNDEELSEQLIQECIANLRWKAENREEQKRAEALASREAEKEIPLPAYLKVTDEGFIQYDEEFIQYQETSCLPTPNGENIGIGPIQYGSKGQVTEIKYSVDDMIILAREMNTSGLGSEMLYQKVWAHVKSCLPIECKESYVKSMVRSAIIMYETSRSSFIQGNLTNENSAQSRIHNYKKVIFSGGECKIYTSQEVSEQNDKNNYDRAMKFIV